MSELRDVMVASPRGLHKYAEATQAEFDEQNGTLKLLRNVHVMQQLVLGDDYTITSKDPRHTMLAKYAGVDHANPGALVFRAIPKKTSGVFLARLP
jgi:hypothetical protein